MRVNNEIAEQIVLECQASWSEPVEDLLVSLHEQDGTKGAQIAAECLKRVMPDITPGEYKKVASDVLRWYVEGDCLDCESDAPRGTFCSHT